MTELSWDDIRQQVYQRANGCCEYCQTCEVNTGQTMQVDHIIPQNTDNLDNLCLSCWNCNNHKRSATSDFDDIMREEVALFNPRIQQWDEHFKWSGDFSVIVGHTATGRATIRRLKMNRPILVVARKRWVESGFHPPYR